MAKKFIEARVIQKVGTEQEWLQNNLVLYEGEIALVSNGDNVVNMKVGDGVHTFSELEYMYRGGFQGSINPTTNTENLQNGFYFAETSGTYTNADNVVVAEGYYTILEKNDSGWKVASSVEMPHVDTSILVAKSDLKISGGIDYTPYILVGYALDSSGNIVTSNRSQLVQNLPISEDETSVEISNFTASSLKKYCWRNSALELVGSVGDFTTMPKTITKPNGAVYLSFQFYRNAEPEVIFPNVKYANSEELIESIGDIKLIAKSLSEDNNTPTPINRNNAVNKGYFDDNAVTSNNISSATVYTTNKLDRSYIVTGKYIDSNGTIMSSTSVNHIIENMPISEFASQEITIDGIIGSSAKKLVFRNELGVIVGKVKSLTTLPYTTTVPLTAVTIDMSLKRTGEDVSSYEFARINIGNKSLPFEPYSQELITSILGKKLYAEQAKGAESGGGNSFDQSLNKTDDVEFNSIKTNQLIYSAIQFNLPTGNGTPPTEVQVGDAWIDTTNNTIKVKMS